MDGTNGLVKDMAECPNCHNQLTLKQILSGPLACPSCHKALRFPRAEYRTVVRPGFYIAIFILTNSMTVHDPQLRIAINVVLLVLWFIFFKRFLHYIQLAVLEVAEDQ